MPARARPLRRVVLLAMTAWTRLVRASGTWWCWSAVASPNAQIAAWLHLSERTVEKHVSSLLRKLGLDSRTAVVWLLRDETVAR